MQDNPYKPFFEVLPFEYGTYTEVFENAWQNELQPGSQAYNRWVQESLNKIMSLRLAVDGDLGSQSRSAIRSFQQKYGLAVDGLVGKQTEAAIKAALQQSSPAGPAVAPASCTGAVLDRFGFDSDAVVQAHQSIIDQLAACIASSQKTSQPVRSVRLVGHTDPVGSATYNIGLGQRRADQVRNALRSRLDATRPGLSSQVTFNVESRGETQPVPGDPARSRRVEVTLITGAPAPQKLPPLGPNETAEYNRLSPSARAQFDELRKIIEGYTGVARTEADRGSRVLLERGVFRSLPGLLPEVLALTKVGSLPSGWNLSTARPLLVGNVLYNLAFPETINQGGRDRLGGTGDPTCFSASTQILLARRFPVTYVRYVIQLAATGKVQFAGGSYSVPTGFVSTSLYKSLDSVLLQTAFDTYFNVSACFISCDWFYQPGDELKVHRQVFGADRPPRTVTWGDKSSMSSAFRKAFVTSGGNTRLPEIANLCTGDPSDPKKCGNHTVVVTRIANGRVFFYNPWPNELERNQMFGKVNVTISGNGERPAESSMTQADFENQLTAVFHN